MTLQEFSDLFDTLYSSDPNNADTIDEYQKSVYLTKAQYLILQEYFERNQNSLGKGFDDANRRLIDFSSLTKTLLIIPTELTTNPYPKFNVWLLTFGTNYDDLVMFFINEMVVVKRLIKNEKTYSSEVTLLVIPISHLELQRALSKPFGEPLKRHAWRFLLVRDRYLTYDLIAEESTTTVNHDIFRQQAFLIVHNREEPTVYTATYIKRPRPIILVDLSETNLSIEGRKTPSNCELDPIIHNEILERAVSLAKLASSGHTGSTATAAKEALRRSE